jgi:phosphopantothenoylcysteine decarboxylase/phosphopantothenate--cysteine ligase
MSEPEEIVEGLEMALGGGSRTGVSVVVSAGGTREPIDPVRYLGNRSSGKMGHAIADEAAGRGASVTLVTSSALPADERVTVVPVETADEMAEAVWAASGSADVAVLAAAVADFRPSDTASTKLRRTDGPPEVALVPTPDILAGVAARDDRPFLVGFAAETGPATDAIDKAVSKGVDLLVANDVTQPDAGFGTDTNRVTIITPTGELDEWPVLTKRQVASRLWDVVSAARTSS